MFKEFFKKLKGKNDRCITVVRENNEILDNHQIVKKRNIQIANFQRLQSESVCFNGVKGLNVLERSRFNLY